MAIDKVISMPESPSEQSVHKVEMAGTSSHDEPSHEQMVLAQEEEERQQLAWSRTRATCQEAFSEFFGTMVLILFGDGVVAQVVLSGGEKGDYQSISWGWGLAVMLGVYVGGKSGGHLNPAVTLASCVYRGFPWRKFPVYFISQLLGAMAGAFIVYGNYKGAIDQFEGGVGIRTVGLETSTAGIFCTYPAAFLDRTAMFWSEVIASTILQFVIFALADPKTGAGNLMPLCLFFLIFGIGACWGWLTGYAINLARDFGPRLVSYILGYGIEVFRTGGSWYFWIPMVAPFFGCLLGGFLYDVFLHDGPSPINTPMMGFARLWQPKRAVWSNTYQASRTSRV
jgi:aquaglyceroporin related protein